MENNEIMTNEEAIDIVDETVTNSGRSSFLECCGAAGLVAVAGYGVYRGGKWLHAKLKEKKAAKKKAADQNDATSTDAETEESK